jgi:alginate O-acetyltransferase complex protein AlgI
VLFNSYIFILVFLPLAVGLFHLARRSGWIKGSIAFLVVASLFFYGWWAPKYLLLLGALMGFDLVIAKGMLHLRNRGSSWSKPLLWVGVAVNLAALGYYKYTNFLVDNADTLLGMHWRIAPIILPIGISFFTFQKVAFLVDLHEGKVDRFHVLDYALFVTFFPQLIAGPIVHHSEVIPQFDRLPRVTRDHFARGITFFVLGLTKKVLLADTAAIYVSPAFNFVASGRALDGVAAWGATLAYTAQLYFDFSAYSDMAIGIGLLFGIRLPLNFDSPYKATSIIDFWRRWHITLSRFLRDYLYFPLGGNRKGTRRRYLNLYVTMLLGGIWHGAGWTFAIWGGLHGLYLVINHAWRKLHATLLSERQFPSWLGRVITFLAVVVAWVFFRAPDVGTAWGMLRSMSGAHGFAAPKSMLHLLPGLPPSQAPIDGAVALAFAIGLLCVAWIFPNTQEIMCYEGPVVDSRSRRDRGTIPWLTWRGSPAWAASTGLLLALCLMKFSQVSEFIYFQF